MDQAIIMRIIGDLGLSESSVAATTAMLEAGATTPFIAHYRKEQSGGLDETKVRAIEERLNYYKEVLERRASLAKILTEQKKLTDDLQNRIDNIFTRVELDDLFHLFKPRKKSRAAEAQEKGLEPLAEFIWGQEPDAWSLEEHADVSINAEKGIPSREQALQGAADIIAEWIAENLELRRHLREMLWKEGNLVSTVVPAKTGQKTKYTMYYDRHEAVTTVPSHRVLAIRRGTKEGVLTSAIECDPAKAVEYVLSTTIKERESAFAPLIEKAARDAYSRILKPLIETEVRAMLKERADREAIRVFQDNLSNLLLTPPAGSMVVLGIDLGKAEECRLAVVDDKGKLIEDAAISLRQPRPEPAPQKAAAPQAPETSPVPASEAKITDAPIQLSLIAPEAAAVEIPSPMPVQANEPAAEPTTTPSEAPFEPTLDTAAENVAVPVEISPELAEMLPAPAVISAVEPEPVEPASEPAAVAEPELMESATEPTAPTGADAPLPTAVPEIPEILTEITVSPGEPSDSGSDTAPVPEAPAPAKPGPPHDLTGARIVLIDFLRRHAVRAIAIGSNSASRTLENLLRQILAEEGLTDTFIAAVNDAGIAIYASSRVAREELPDLNVSARCAVSLARRLQDPLAELVKIDPKLIGVGQYQHDVDQKELHRGLLQTVRSCVNNVGPDPNAAGHSLLRYVAGLNDKLARRIISTRHSAGPFQNRSSLLGIQGMDHVAFEQAAGFLRVRISENRLDRSAIHPESYPVVEKMAASLGVAVGDLVGNREQVSKLKLEDFITEKIGLPTLKDIREELLRPGRDPRRTFAMPKFRSDVKEIGDLKEGMTLEGTVTNVTNFGAFVDVGVRQDGLVHLSQMSNRFIRDPREAVKVGDVVQVKVISVEAETKRIGLSIKALLPALPRRRKKVPRKPIRPAGAPPVQAPGAGAETAASDPPAADPSATNTPRPQIASRRPDSHRRHDRERRPEGGRRPEGNRRPQRPRGDRRPPRSETVVAMAAVDLPPPIPEEPRGPEPTLQEKIALLKNKFRGIS